MLALILFPLSAALLYSLGALVLKRSNDLGVGVWRTTFVVNVIVAICFSVLWTLGGPPINPELLWQPALIALCLFGGQLTQFIALDRGDVSVVVPLFGLKVILIAFLTPFITGEPVSPGLWIAGVLSVAGVTFLNQRATGGAKRGKPGAVVAAIGGATCFAVFDVLVQRWGPTWGVGRLLPCIFWINAVLSLGLVTQFRAPLWHIPRQAWGWLAGGSVLLGVQSVLFVGFLAVYGKATAANIVYSSRGLLSVILIWTVGHWFANTEQNLGAKVLRWRLLGAALMLTAIGLVVAG